MSKLGISLSQILAAFALALSAAAAPPLSTAQQARLEAKDAKPAPTEKNAAQIELLETKYRFETNGDSRKEVHTRVRINNELGARQFARLNFDFNRSFQSVEIPMVHVTHASGGTADILPSAITDNPNPAVVDYPAYHDVRVKSVRILGLQPDDLLEYRVITTTTHHPLAPDFWLDHTFDRSGVVSEELFEVDVPAARQIHLYRSPAATYTFTDESINGLPIRAYRWKNNSRQHPPAPSDENASEADVALTTFDTWQQLAARIAESFEASAKVTSAIREKEISIAGPFTENHGRDIKALYDFVAQKIRTVDLPLGSTGFRTRGSEEILSSGYATQEDKFVLFAAISREAVGLPYAGLVSGTMPRESARLPRPSVFDHLLTDTGIFSTNWWLDLNLEVAPFRAIPSQFRGKRALLIGAAGENCWREIPADRPYHAQQTAVISATLLSDGALKAKVKYDLRGDNELLLRVAFHKTEKEKWKDVAQMLALSDGFRGQITNVTASDPYATNEPFTVEYEISQPKFVDWSKKTVRTPAILPLPGLPDPPTAAQIEAQKPIDLGTPLAIDLEATIELPAGATAQAPIGTTVNRDYATFSSKYSVQGTTLHASRSLHFISSELPAARATDFNAFLHAVQSDQTQLFTIQPSVQK